MTYLVVDLETTPDLSRWSAPADKPDAFPPTWAHRIVCIGWMLLGHDYAPAEIGALMPGGESAILKAFSRMVAAHRPTIVSFNGRSFDLPVIAHRALCHGVQLPWYYKNRYVRYRFSEEGHLDLCDALTDYGACTKPTLDAMAKLIGLPGKVGVDGSDVAGLYAAGELDKIEHYCLADVAQTALLLLRFRLIQGALKHAEYEAARDGLMRWFASDSRLADLFAAGPAILPCPAGAPLASGDSGPARALPDTGDLFERAVP